MLVLSRKESQTIMIGDGIELTVVAIQGRLVKLGIKAPKNVPIRRSELEPNSGPPPTSKKTTRTADLEVELDNNQIVFA